MQSAKLEIFQTVQNDLSSIGYGANQSPFNNDVLGQSATYILFIICECVYLCRFDKTPEELSRSILMLTVGIAVFISFLSTVQQMATIFTFINETGKIVNDSELKAQCTFDHFICIILIELISISKNMFC